jgi:hypothetical protein
MFDLIAANIVNQKKVSGVKKQKIANFKIHFKLVATHAKHKVKSHKKVRLNYGFFGLVHNI